MNTVCIAIEILFFVCILTGWIQGLFRVVISIAGLVASIVIATYAAPYLSGYLEENTQIDDKIASYISEELQFSDLSEEVSKGIQVALINELPLPEGIKTGILNNKNPEMYEALDVSCIYDYVAKFIAVVILNATVFLSLLLMCRIFFFFLGKAVGDFKNLPIVKWIDKIGGGIFGAVKGIIFIWIIFLILSVTSTFVWSGQVIEQINQSGFLKLLYDKNLLLDIVGDLTKVLFF